MHYFLFGLGDACNGFLFFYSFYLFKMASRIVSDSSSIISMAINCMSTVLGELGVEFIVSPEVFDEVVTRPSTSKRYMLESIRIKKLFSDGVIRVESPSKALVDRIMDVSNSVFRVHRQNIKLIHLGEAAALALAAETNADAFLIDERTMRMLLEDPEQLREILSSQINRSVEIDYRRLEVLRGLIPQINLIRSAEVVAVAYEKGVLGRVLGDGRKEAFLSVLYALKFSGCSISWDEIEEYSSLIQ